MMIAICTRLMELITDPPAALLASRPLLSRPSQADIGSWASAGGVLMLYLLLTFRHFLK